MSPVGPMTLLLHLSNNNSPSKEEPTEKESATHTLIKPHPQICNSSSSCLKCLVNYSDPFQLFLVVMKSTFKVRMNKLCKIAGKLTHLRPLIYNSLKSRVNTSNTSSKKKKQQFRLRLKLLKAKTAMSRASKSKSWISRTHKPSTQLKRTSKRVPRIKLYS